MDIFWNFKFSSSCTAFDIGDGQSPRNRIKKLKSAIQGGHQVLERILFSFAKPGKGFKDDFVACFGNYEERHGVVQERVKAISQLYADRNIVITVVCRKTLTETEDQVTPEPCITDSSETKRRNSPEIFNDPESIHAQTLDLIGFDDHSSSEPQVLSARSGRNSGEIILPASALQLDAVYAFTDDYEPRRLPIDHCQVLAGSIIDAVARLLVEVTDIEIPPEDVDRQDALWSLFETVWHGWTAVHTLARSCVSDEAVNNADSYKYFFMLKRLRDLERTVDYDTGRVSGPGNREARNPDV